MGRRKNREAEVKRLRARFLRTFAQECRREGQNADPNPPADFRGSTIFPLTVDEQGNELPLPDPPKDPFVVKRNDIAVSFIAGDQERIAENARRGAARTRRGESQ